MGEWVTTLGIAFVIIALALAGMAIGWILTGKSKLVRGGCGKTPSQVKKEGCNDDDAGCSLCGGGKKEKNDEP